MSSLQFYGEVLPPGANGIADPDSITIGVLDQTTGTQAITAGTAVARVSTGIYRYVMTSPTDGHTYLATWTYVYNSTTYTFTTLPSVVVTSAPSPPSSPVPITSSAQMVGTVEQQLADIATAKALATQNLITAQTNLATMLAAGTGDVTSVSDGGVVGTEGYTIVSLQAKIDSLTKAISGFVNTELLLLQMLQDLQPFNIRERVHVGYRNRGYR